MQTGPTLSSQIELSISCNHLANLDLLSKSDPMCVVYAKPFNPDRSIRTKWIEIGRTEMFKNNRNPKFVTAISIKYCFEEVQPLRFLVVDVDHPKSTAVRGKDCIGKFKTTLGAIVGAIGNTLIKDLENHKHPHRKNGSITVRATEIPGGNKDVRFQIRGEHLDKKDFFGKSDPFLIFYRADHSTPPNFNPIHQTEVIKKSLDPVWNDFSIPLGKLCGCDPMLQIMIECYDWDSDSKRELIGRFTTNYNELLSGHNNGIFELIEPKKHSKKGYHNSGVLHIKTTEIIIPTFLDYLSGGTEITMVVGIDFTGSNGDPSDDSSLHSLTREPNEYMAAIRVVGDIVAPYARQQTFPAYGYGAFLRDAQITSHCFAVNGNEQNPFCEGVYGILQAYQNVFNRIDLSGPTNFFPLIQAVNNIARQHPDGSKYIILLIITDGAITDEAHTIQGIRESVSLPMSIIIVGVGQGDFTDMSILDDDDHQLGFARDVVQFVPFRKYAHLHPGALTQDILAEIPNQFLTYMSQNRIPPRAPQVVQLQQ